MLEPNELASIATVLSALSVASERLVEIIKGLVPFLDGKQQDEPDQERRRKMTLQVVSVAAGILTAAVACNSLPGLLPGGWEMHETSAILVYGLLASGGSGLWNSVLDYANELKKLKRQEVLRIRAGLKK